VGHRLETYRIIFILICFRPKIVIFIQNGLFMSKILGLDLGTTSIGWALMEKGASVIDGGVVIFPRGNNLDGTSGKEISYSQQRTLYRGMRRRLYRRNLRRDRLLQNFKNWWGISSLDIYTNSKPEDLYRIRAEAIDPEKDISLNELCRVFLYFAKKRGFKSNRKSAGKAGEDVGVVKEGILDLKTELGENECKTLGQYFHKLITAHKKGERLDERILQRWTGREMYQYEYDMIIQTQLGRIQDLDEEKASAIRKEIFFQRPLRSAKHLVSNCQFESQKKVMPRSHPVFQEFRLWQMLHNLTWINKDTGEYSGLSLDQMALAADLYLTKKKPTETQLKSKIGLSTRVQFNEVVLKPCSTFILMEEAVGTTAWKGFTGKDKLDIYHSILFTDDDNQHKFVEYLLKKWGLSKEQSQNLFNLILEPDYGSISHKAAKKMIPFLQSGYPYDQAAVKAGYHHSVRNTHLNLDYIPYLKSNEMRNPVVQKAVGQCINLVNHIIKQYGKPDEVVVELARDLKKPKEAREKQWRRNKNIERKREEYALILSKYRSSPVATWDSLITKYELWLELGCEDDGLKAFDGFAEKIRTSDMEKYRLWLESGRVSPYSGKVINLTDLFSPHIEIEHIVPFSRSLDNSRLNKTLCERTFNHDKSNKTPLEYFENKSQVLSDDFIKRIGYINNEIKREQFLKKGPDADYLNSQLSDTAFIARRIVEKLSTSIPKIGTSKGRLTSLLRTQWGLNNLLYNDTEIEPQTIVTIKNRGDHRHHFIDACLLASITPAIVQKVSKMEIGNSGKLSGVTINPPFERFRTEVSEKVNEILTVHRMNNKFLNKTLNSYRQSESPNKTSQISTSVRGSLHEDTLYGKIELKDGSQKFVVRKPVNQLNEKQLGNIVDQGIKVHLQHLIVTTPGGWKELIKSPILFQGRPLRHVRWMASDVIMPLLRPDTQTYISPGNNLLMAIYENETGLRKFISLSFYEAMQRRRNQEILYPATQGDYRLKFTIKPYDKFIWCEHPDQVDWDDNEDLQQRLYYVIKFTGSSIYLGQAHVANVKADYDKKPIKIYCTYNTMRAVKVRQDIQGRIIWRSDSGMIKA